jgi:FlaA1/EpsC-like NDP-sugar epimerase
MGKLLRNKHFYIIFFIDAVLMAISLYLAYAIRFEFHIPAKELTRMLRILPIVFFIRLSSFLFFRMYQGMWRYTSLPDLLNVAKAVFASTATIIIAVLVIYHFIGYPRSVFIIDSVLTFLFIGGFRVGIRLYFAKDSGVKIFPALARIRPQRRKFLIIEAGSFLLDAILVVASFYLAYAIRFEFQISPSELKSMLSILPFVFIIKMSTFVFFRMYQGMWRFASLEDMLNVIKAIIVSTVGIVVAVLVMYRFQGYSRSVFFIDCGLSLLFIGGIRVGARLHFTGNGHRGLFSLISTEVSGKKKLLIIGAGYAGEKVLREILDNPTLNFIPAGFLDDEPGKLERTIHGVKVLGTVDQIESFHTLFDEILIALPSASGQQMRRIVAACKKTGKRFRTIPSIGELIDGRVSVKTIRDVTLQDLLDREEVKLDVDEISSYLCGKRVLITGAGGSIGSELVRQVSRFHPKALALLEMGEFNLFRVEMECRQRFAYVKTSSFLADIRDQESLNRIFKVFRPQVVFHTAAYKHVPLQELHPWEAIRNNVLGTRNLVQVVLEEGHTVERFVLVSTDKAVRPTNVMGATKRIAEQLTLSANRRSQSQFMVVRFGNVLGSSGSVIPTFQDQIARGGPVTVTHPKITRYFMSIPEAAQLILEASSMGAGGETFILDMGDPVHIADMARDLIRLHGYEPDRDIAIQYIGLRPGEKLYEELITEGEGIVKTKHEKILVLQGNGYDWDTLQYQTDELLEIARAYDRVKIKLKLQEIVPEYLPEFWRLNEQRSRRAEKQKSREAEEQRSRRAEEQKGRKTKKQKSKRIP